MKNDMIFCDLPTESVRLGFVFALSAWWRLFALCIDRPYKTINVYLDEANDANKRKKTRNSIASAPELQMAKPQCNEIPHIIRRL